MGCVVRAANLNEHCIGKPLTDDLKELQLTRSWVLHLLQDLDKREELNPCSLQPLSFSLLNLPWSVVGAASPDGFVPNKGGLKDVVGQWRKVGKGEG